MATSIIRASTGLFYLILHRLSGPQGLNKDTVPDKCPILMIDELLHKLHGSAIYSKLNVKLNVMSCYQTRVLNEDIQKTVFRTHRGIMNSLNSEKGNSYLGEHYFGLWSGCTWRKDTCHVVMPPSYDPT